MGASVPATAVRYLTSTREPSVGNCPGWSHAAMSALVEVVSSLTSKSSMPFASPGSNHTQAEPRRTSSGFIETEVASIPSMRWKSRSTSSVAPRSTSCRTVVSGGLVYFATTTSS